MVIIMIEKLNKLNENIKFYSVFDKEFSQYGEVIKDADVEELCKAAEKIEMPEKGVKYFPGVESLENVSNAKEIKERFFGFLPAQIGYCYGSNSVLDSTEWHTSSEFNVAVTDVILLLANRWQIKNNKIDSSEFKGFFVPKGTVIETYATTLHYTPCEADENGFGWVVILPQNTNTPLDNKTNNPILWAKNKWMITHVDNEVNIKKGAFAGITGENFVVKYK